MTTTLMAPPPKTGDVHTLVGVDLTPIMGVGTTSVVYTKNVDSLL